MYEEIKKKIYGLLDPDSVGIPKWDRFVNVFIIVLIVLNVIAVMLETVPSMHDEYYEQRFFNYFDLISVGIFTVEYLLRLWSATYVYKYKHWFWGRLRYMFTLSALIDLAAILPSYLHAFIGLDLRVLRMLRLLRFLRLFKLTAYMKSSTQLISGVLKRRASELTLSFVMIFFLIIIASCIMYFAEHLHPINKDKFTSIPATMWWAVVTLTTTGYGDMYPMTTMGKIMSGLIMLTGFAVFAIPAGIFYAGFLEEFRRRNKKRRKKSCPHCGKSLDTDEDDNH
ncbi:MAG: ion transporter [Chitinophagaceae bacterium]|nr:ion transporter [Chitinophagaceae bacterium]